MKTFTLFMILTSFFVLVGCAVRQKEKIVPAVVPPAQKTDMSYKTKLKIIGGVEPIYILPLKSSFVARVDTGAGVSSIDAKNIKEFERDGEKWVSFTVFNRKTKEKHFFEKPLVRNARIRRAHIGERRKVVNLDVIFGGQTLKVDFTLVDREQFDYQVLIGRNIINGRAIVDPTRSMTFR